MSLKMKGRREVAADGGPLPRVSQEAEARPQSQNATAAVRQESIDDVAQLWRMIDFICGKRLQPILPELVTLGAWLHKNQLA